MPLKLLILNKLYHPHIGGVEKVVKELAEGLTSLFSIRVLVANKKRKTERKVIRGVDVTYTKSLGIYFSMPISFSYLLYFLKYLKWADILHLHLPFPLGVLCYLFSRPKKPTIVTWHSDIVRQKFFLFFYRWFLFRLLEKVETIVATSYQLIYSSSFLPYFAHKIKVVPLSFQEFRYKTWVSSMKVYVDKKREVLFVGRFVYYKGIKYLLSAMKEIDGKCVLIGDGKDKKSIEKYIAENGLVNKVVIKDRVGDEELKEYYRRATVFVLPSIVKSEAYGIVLLEALSFFAPIITFDLPTGVSFVNDGISRGIRVPIGNTKSLAKAIRILLDNKKLSYKMGRRGRRWVNNLPDMSKEYAKIIMELGGDFYDANDI